MLFIVFITFVFGIINVLFLFVLVSLNELFLLSLKTGKWTLLVILMIIGLFILIALSPDIDPVNIDLITVISIVIFSTTALYVMFNLYRVYRTRIGTISFFGDSVLIDPSPDTRVVKRSSSNSEIGTNLYTRIESGSNNQLVSRYLYEFQFDRN